MAILSHHLSLVTALQQCAQGLLPMTTWPKNCGKSAATCLASPGSKTCQHNSVFVTGAVRFHFVFKWHKRPHFYAKSLKFVSLESYCEVVVMFIFHCILCSQGLKLLWYYLCLVLDVILRIRTMSWPCCIHINIAYCDNMYINLIKCCLSGETPKVIIVCDFDRIVTVFYLWFLMKAWPFVMQHMCPYAALNHNCSISLVLINVKHVLTIDRHTRCRKKITCIFFVS